MLENNFDYKPFLKEAYIQPIRTVTVIDDEYPTLEHLVTKGKEGFKEDDIKRLSDIIKVSRSEKFNWLLDVYDGKEEVLETDNVSRRLHHSDLLILDYHLDGEDDGLCQKSLNIIKHLADNRHFNIVAVHTKGYTGEKGSVNDVLCDIIASLQAKPNQANLHEKPRKMVEKALDLWGDETTEIKNELVNSISKIDMLYLIHHHSTEMFSAKLEHEMLNAYKYLYEQKPDDIELCEKLLIRWLISEKYKTLEDISPIKTAKHFDWGVVGEVNWIKTEDLFLTVVGKKATQVKEIPEKLLSAMECWRPHPHKLILSKLRNDVESKGISASSNILNKKHLQAAWLKELLITKTDYESKTAAWSTVSKLWEELATEIKGDLGDFTIRLLNALNIVETDKTKLLNYFVPPESDTDELEQVKHANCFSCSRKISTHHIITGHILKIGDNYLLCLTPICDLVPDQKNKDLNVENEQEIKALMPVTLVQMYDASQALKLTRESMRESLNLPQEHFPELSKTEVLQQVINYSTQNNLLFIQPDGPEGDIKILSFTAGLDGKANPKSKNYYIENQGIFQEGEPVNLHIAEPCDKGVMLKVTPQKGIVVAELRYEYALNLLSRLGFAKSRVGLDFIN
ncbi:hypothetical protein FQP81_19925 [Pseudoalteromonas distincta]|uniref:response regulator receiver domain n=1 Tax=Pseudoalteromonas distincta TaxID=77608 RepID=UPI0011953DA0|nr:response regulator receiver domain [Pseudoalteromonas elyakovii]TVU68662.1 hypothetical protein FQP81_19925 [Pseudoalteromonas elyakovii]|tara:strand:- start:727 stop:2604 length:1878 start_codon:yes stop_codon:yes gene_type:complete